MLHSKKDAQEIKSSEWVDSKNTQTVKQTTSEWVDSKNAQTFKPTSSGEWVDSKSKQVAGEWVSSKNAQIEPRKSAIGELTIHADHADSTENVHVGPPINIITTPRRSGIAESHVE